MLYREAEVLESDFGQKASIHCSSIFFQDLKACVQYFLNAMYECTKIQENHPFCAEDNPNFNPIMCAIRLNICIVEEIQGISSCIE